MVTVKEQHGWGRGSQRWRQETSHATQSASGLPRASSFLGPFRRLRGVMVAGLVLWCAGLVGLAGAATITEFNGNKIGRITTTDVTPGQGQSAASVIYSNFGPGMTFDTNPSHGWGINGFIAQDTGQQAIANQFTPATTVAFTGAQVALSLFRGPGNVAVFLQADSNGLPGPVLEQINVSGLTSLPTIFTATSVLRPTLQGGIPYWLTVVAGGPGVVAGWHWNAIGDSSVGGNFAGTQGGSPAGPWAIGPVSSGQTRSVFQICGPAPCDAPIGTASAFVTRLYEQVLNREPDAAGLQGFLQQITQFGSVVPTVLGFFHSPEFLARNTDHAQFLAILYHTFLNRDPDQTGFTAFLTSLQLGQLTRDNLLDIFMDSQEFQAQASFLPALDPLAAFVTTLYVRILGRGPDQAGRQRFVAEAQRACTTLPTVQTLLASPEFQARHTTNTEFVTLLYRVFLGRVPDAGGLTGFVTPLTQGTVTRDQLVAQFAASAEFQAVQQHLFPPGSCTPIVCLSVYWSGLGSVTVNPQGTNGGPNCGRAFAPGTTVTLTAQGGPSYLGSFARFLGWGGDCAAIGRRENSSHGTCTLVMTTSKTVSADFDCPLFLCGYLSPSEDAWPGE